MRNWYKYSFLPFLRTKRDKIAMSIVWRLPKWILYWSVVRVACKAAGNDSNPGDVKSIKMLEKGI